MSDLHGVLIVDKPAGITSAAVVSRVKRLLGGGKVGHTGTLDPLATGVLPLCVGEGTKVAGYLTARDKEYSVSFVLGVETDTLDSDGKVVRERPEQASRVTRADLESAARRFVGDTSQIPPMYSAVRVGGKRLHRLARAGLEVERAPRPITVHRYDITEFDAPVAKAQVSCSKGTYVRTLVADLGEAVGCGAHVNALRRTRSGSFALDSAVSLDELESSAAQAVIDPDEALAHLPSATVPESLIDAVACGKPLKWEDISAEPAPQETLRLRAPWGGLLALVAVEGSDSSGKIRYARVFSYALTRAPQSFNLRRSKNTKSKRV